MNRLIVGMLGIAAATFAATAAGSAELRVGLVAEPTSIDPHYHNLTPNNGFSRNVFDGLINTDEKQRL